MPTLAASSDFAGTGFERPAGSCLQRTTGLPCAPSRGNFPEFTRARHDPPWHEVTFFVSQPGD